MQYYPESIQNLIRNLARLPGIGNKTAERLAMHILRQPERDAQQLAKSIVDLKKRLRLCSRCFSLSDDSFCRVCRDPSRSGELVCVVEQPADMASIEKSGSFRGRYHILGGVLSPMDGIGPADIRIAELVERVEKEGVGEVVLATGTNVEGESTAAYIANLLSGHAVTVTRIASGVPMGGDLKYVDQVTLKRAMESRHGIHNRQ
jgi:recombination protein RecR